MNVLLIKPVIEFTFSTKTPPMGLMYIAAYLRKENPDVNICIHDYAISGEITAEKIALFKPDIVGISALTLEMSIAESAARLSRSVYPDVPVIIGGPCAFDYSGILEKALFDYVCVGEGELVFAELVNKLNFPENIHKIPGIAYMSAEGVRLNTPQLIEDLDSLPFPAWDLIDFPAYSFVKTMADVLDYGSFYMPVFTSRGCPFHCVYCHHIFGKKVRLRSADNVCAEIEELVNRYGINEIHIFDDIFNIDRDRLIEICQRIEQYQLKIAFPNGVRADMLDKEQITALKNAGTYFMSVAVESGSPRIQKLLSKNLNLEKVLENIEIAHQEKIFTVGFVMIGFPFETLGDIMMTSNYLAQTKLNIVYFFQVTPYPGTTLYEMSENMGAIHSLYTDKAFFLKEYYEAENSVSPINIRVLNMMLLFMRLRFYHPKRIFNIFRMFRNRRWYFKTIVNDILYLFRIMGKIVWGQEHK